MSGNLSVWHSIPGYTVVFFEGTVLQPGPVDWGDSCGGRGSPYVVVYRQGNGPGGEAGGENRRDKQSHPVLGFGYRDVCADLYGFCESDFYVLRLYGNENIGIYESLAA